MEYSWMVRIKCITVILLFPGMIQGLQSQNASAVLFESKRMYDKYVHMSFNLEYEHVFLSGDTIKDQVVCQLDRDTTDKLFHGSFCVKFLNSLYYYNLKELFYINYQKRSVTEYGAIQNKGFPVKGNMTSAFLEVGFFNTSQFIAQVDKHGNDGSVYLDSVTNHYVVRIDIEDSPPYSNIHKLIYINRANNVIDEIRSRVNKFDEFQDVSWKLSNIRFDNPDSCLMGQDLEALKATFT